MKNILPLLLLTILAGCVVNQPLPKGYTGPTAWLEDTHSDGDGTSAKIFQIVSVDGRPVLRSTAVTAPKNVMVGIHKFKATSIGRYVPAGSLQLELEGITQTSAPIFELLNEVYNISGHLNVTLEENIHYRVVGILTNDYRAIWIESEKGEIISNIIEEGVKP